VFHVTGVQTCALPISQPDRDPMPVADALVRRLHAWRSRAQLTPEELAIVDAHGPQPSLFEGAVRVPCHRDFAPRNWLWTGVELRSEERRVGNEGRDRG